MWTYAQASRQVTEASGSLLTVLPSDVRIEASDYVGVLTKNISRMMITRAIDSSAQGDSSNYKRTTPATRFRFAASVAGTGSITINLNYTGEVARVDPYNPYASVYVNGSLMGDISGPPGKIDGDGNPQPVGISQLSMSLESGNYQIEIMCPSYAAVELNSLIISSEAPVNEPAPYIKLNLQLV